MSVLTVKRPGFVSSPSMAAAWQASLTRVGAADSAGAADAATGVQYDAYTQRAIDAQVFGVPWYVYRGQPFWGQDRLDFLDRELAK